MRRARQRWVGHRTPFRSAAFNSSTAPPRLPAAALHPRTVAPSSPRLAAVPLALADECGPSAPRCTSAPYKPNPRRYGGVGGDPVEQPCHSHCPTTTPFRSCHTKHGPARACKNARGGMRGGRVHRDRATHTAAAPLPSTAFSVRGNGNRRGTSTPAAVTAFHALLRERNSPYVRTSVDGAAVAATAALAPYLPRLQGHEVGDQERSFHTGEVPSPAPTNNRAEAERRARSARALASAPSQGDWDERLKTTVMREWSLYPTEVRPTAAAAAAAAPSSSPMLPPLHTLSFPASQSTHGQHGGQQDAERQRKRELVKQARLDTMRQLKDRHRQEYESTTLHAYQLLKKSEDSLFRWSQQRRQQRGRGSSGDSTAASSSSSVQPDENGSGTAASRVGGDVDAVHILFFEYAGQLRRTLHQLTPHHFDAMRAYRLRRTSPSKREQPARFTAEKTDASLATSPPQRFHIRLLWRLLHITHLFYTIGRHASLPRSVVHSYVQSANCAYGIRESLRVLGEELALTSLRCSTTSHPTLSPSPPASLSRDELFQIFYAALCISSEEVPGVPIYDPAALAARDICEPSLLRFQLDCVSTGAVTARMPVDEWCVRWWCHVYAEHNAAASLSVKCTSPRPGNGMDALLTTGQAMDVIRASLYAIAHTEVTSSSLASASTRASAMSPLVYFETPPRGGLCSSRGTKNKRGASLPHNTTSTASTPSDAQQQQQQPQRGLDRRYRPRLISALGGDRTRLRIPYHLGQRFLTVFLQHLLSSTAAASSPNPSKPASANTEGEGDERAGYGEAASASAFTSSAASVEAGMRGLLSRRDRDAVRDVALLCTAILFFEVFSADTAAFMAFAAPLCREQVELLSGHEISCVLLAYASLRCWEGRTGDTAGGTTHTHPMKSAAAYTKDNHNGGCHSASASGHGRAEADEHRRHHRAEDVFTTVSVRSASAALKAGQSRSAAMHSCSSSATVTSGESLKAAPFAVTSPAPEADVGHTINTARERRPAESAGSAAFSSSSAESSAKQNRPSSSSSWDLFYVTLGSRAGQLSDTLSEEDVARVLRAMELVGLEHEDLRRTLESSLRMRNLGRSVLYET